MTIKSNSIVFRVFCIVVIALSIFYYPINNGLFGFLIFVSSILLLFGGTESIELTNSDVTFRFERLIQLWTKQRTIRISDIKGVQYIPGKISGVAIFLNLIGYSHDTVNPKDEIVIELIDGETYSHQVVGTRKEYKELFERLDEKINTTRE